VTASERSELHTTRLATSEDAVAVARLLHDFNREFGDPTPGPAELAERIVELLRGGDTKIMVIGAPPAGVSVMRFRLGLWTRALECHLAELYVVPSLRHQGLGRRLMEASMAVAREHGADYMDLGTAETDLAARALYESLGFSNREGKPDGPLNYYYEREL
jgi:ribosomal protein S18 acetylase RimI-like enzyme